jgi:hypothetical protein
MGVKLVSDIEEHILRVFENGGEENIWSEVG